MNTVLDDIQSRYREQNVSPVVLSFRASQSHLRAPSAKARAFWQNYWLERAWMLRMGFEQLLNPDDCM